MLSQTFTFRRTLPPSPLDRVKYLMLVPAVLLRLVAQAQATFRSQRQPCSGAGNRTRVRGRYPPQPDPEARCDIATIQAAWHVAGQIWLDYRLWSATTRLVVFGGTHKPLPIPGSPLLAPAGGGFVTDRNGGATALIITRDSVIRAIAGPCIRSIPVTTGLVLPSVVHRLVGRRRAKRSGRSQCHTRHSPSWSAPPEPHSPCRNCITVVLGSASQAEAGPGKVLRPGNGQRACLPVLHCAVPVGMLATNSRHPRSRMTREPWSAGVGAPAARATTALAGLTITLAVDGSDKGYLPAESIDTTRHSERKLARTVCSQPDRGRKVDPFTGFGCRQGNISRDGHGCHPNGHVPVDAELIAPSRPCNWRPIAAFAPR